MITGILELLIAVLLETLGPITVGIAFVIYLQFRNGFQRLNYIRIALCILSVVVLAIGTDYAARSFALYTVLWLVENIVKISIFFALYSWCTGQTNMRVLLKRMNRVYWIGAAVLLVLGAGMQVLTYYWASQAYAWNSFPNTLMFSNEMTMAGTFLMLLPSGLLIWTIVFLGRIEREQMQERAVSDDRVRRSYAIVLIASLVHGMTAFLYLQQMPELDGIGKPFWISLIIWIGLFGALYYAMEVVLKDKGDTTTQRALALGIGCGCTAVIAGIDYLFRVNELLNKDEMKLLLIRGIVVCAFGAAVMGILFFRVGMRKIRENWMEKSGKPLAVLCILVVGYVGIWLLGKQGPGSVDMYSQSNEFFSYHFSMISILVYTIFYPVFWWFLQCSTRPIE